MLGLYYTVWDSGEFEKLEKVNAVVIKVNEWKKNTTIPVEMTFLSKIVGRTKWVRDYRAVLLISL